MMDDLVLNCCRQPADSVTFQDEEFGVTSIAFNHNLDQCGVVVSREDALRLHAWLTDYLRIGMPWVDCKERLPATGQICLVYRPDAPKTQDPIFRTAVFTGKHFACYVQPSHWMPLTHPMILSEHTINEVPKP